MHLYLAANDTSYQAGRIAGRLIYLALIPVFAIALNYLLVLGFAVASSAP